MTKLLTKIIVGLFLAVAFLPLTGKAQVVSTSYGEVEFLGLKSWSVEQIKDTLAVISPETELHACAIVLKEKLGFPEASVYKFFYEGKVYSVATVVEPMDGKLVQYRAEDSFDDFNNLDIDWQLGLKLFEDNPLSFQTAIRTYGIVQKNGNASAKEVVAEQGIDIESVELVWTFFKKNKTSSNLEKVLSTLNKDRNPDNRLIATALLMNFSDRNEAWWALVNTLRDPNSKVRTMASTVLWSYNKYFFRKVEWKPAQITIKHILNGTNINSLYNVLDMLVLTGVSHDLAPYLFEEGGGLVMTFLSANHPEVKEKAHSLLVQLSGKDYGYDVGKWESWIVSL